MDPLSLLVTSLAAGAAAALKDTATQAVKDAYAGLTNLIRRKLGRDPTEALQRNPASVEARQATADELAKHGPIDDEMLNQARRLLELVRTHAPETLQEIGVDVSGLTAKSLTVDDVESSGIGVKLRESDIVDDVVITKVRARPGAPPANP